MATEDEGYENMEPDVDVNDDSKGQFVPLELGDPDAWDDSALVQAYQAAVDAHSNPGRRKSHASSPTPKTASRPQKKQGTPATSIFKEKGTDSEKIGAKSPTDNLFIPAQKPPYITPSSVPSPSLPRTTPILGAIAPETLIPPPPPPIFGNDMSEDLEKLLMTWYEAGYRAGVYTATTSRQGKKNYIPSSRRPGHFCEQ